MYTLVRSWLSNCLAPKVVASLPPIELAVEIWANIKDMYDKLDLAKLFPLRQCLVEINQGNNFVTHYFNKFSTIWHKLDAAEGKLNNPQSTLNQFQNIKNQEWLNHFLLSLNESFLSFLPQILAVVPPLDLW